MAKTKRYSVYDVMEAQGVFEANPANSNARDPETSASLYSGPVEYPKMLYDPEGAVRELVPTNWIDTPLGPKATDRQEEVVYKVVHNKKEEEELLAKGWHKTLAASRAAATGEDLPKTQAELIADKEQEIKDLQAKLLAATSSQNAAKAAALGPTPTGKKA